MWPTSIQIVPPSATKYNSLKRADLYQDGNELQQKINHNGRLDQELENFFVKWQLVRPKGKSTINPRQVQVQNQIVAFAFSLQVEVY